MLTLTVDPKQFDSPLEAWRHIGQVRGVSELMRELKRRKLVLGPEYFYALEFQKQTEMPHYHIVSHAGFIDKHIVQQIWNLGHTWISRSKRMDSVGHAVNYATKYITKRGEFPEWVLKHQGNIRLFSTSRGLLAPRKKPKYKTGRKRSGEKVKPIEQRLKACGQKTKLLADFAVIGGVKTKHVETFDVPYNEAWQNADVNVILQELKYRSTAKGSTHAA